MSPKSSPEYDVFVVNTIFSLYLEETNAAGLSPSFCVGDAVIIGTPVRDEIKIRIVLNGQSSAASPKKMGGRREPRSQLSIFNRD